MPAVITHDMFGKELYRELCDMIGDTREECNAFLLGCQGPDVFFFGVLDPTIAPSWGLGSKMHRTNPAVLLHSLIDAANDMVDEAAPIGRAYAMGMYCHYVLDSMMHPLIYAQQYAICDAGIEGLDRSDGHDVHAEIESELDILTLTAKEGATIAQFNPAAMILHGDERTLSAISCMHKRVAKELFGLSIPVHSFSQSVYGYRVTLAAMHSPSGIKRNILGRIERLVRRHSFIAAMSHRNKLLYESSFDNRDRAEWVDTNTLEVRNESYWDLYSKALARARAMLPRIMHATLEELERETGGLDFNGKPTTVRIIKVE